MTDLLDQANPLDDDNTTWADAKAYVARLRIHCRAARARIEADEARIVALEEVLKMVVAYGGLLSADCLVIAERVYNAMLAHRASEDARGDEAAQRDFDKI